MPTLHPTALSKLSAAVEAAVGSNPFARGRAGATDELSVSLPNLPKSSLLSRPTRNEKTNPPRGEDDVRHRVPAPITNQKSKVENPPSLSQTFRNLPESSISSRASGNEKTNPPLPPRQLAAARLLVKGSKVGEVAKEMGVTRQTIGTWKRSENFINEVYRLHEMIARELKKR